MKRISMIIHSAREMLTLKGTAEPRRGQEMKDPGLISDAAVAVDGDRITAVGRSEEILADFEADNVVNAAGKVVMPGFVDPHTHPVFVRTREQEFEMRIMGRSYVEISQSGGGIKASIADVREASESELYDLAVPRIKRMIACGTTTLEAKSGYGLTTESELKMLRVIRKLNEDLPVDIIPTFLGAHEIPPEYSNDRSGYVDLIVNEMLPEVVRTGLALYCDIFTEKHVFSVAESRKVLRKAKESGLKIRMHADEIEPVGGAELAAEMGAVSADHLGAASDNGILAMKKAGVIPVLLPGTIFSLGMNSYARARFMIDNGLAVALATDFNPGSCNCDSMQFVTTLATLNMKMTVAEAICASTINAAYSLGIGHEVGSLEPGKKADILIMDMPSYHYLPYHIGSNNIERVYKSGQLIYQNNY